MAHLRAINEENQRAFRHIFERARGFRGKGQFTANDMVRGLVNIDPQRGNPDPLSVKALTGPQRTIAEPAVIRYVKAIALAFVNSEWPREVRIMVQEAIDYHDYTVPPPNTRTWKILLQQCYNSQRQVNITPALALKCILRRRNPPAITRALRQRNLEWMDSWNIGF